MRLALPLAALLLVLAIAPAFLGGTAAAAPPPEPLCGVCGDSIDGATERGTLGVHLEDGGDSRWIERVPLTESAADRYREDPDRLERDVEEGWARYHVAGGDVTDRSVTLEDDTVVVSYTVADVARPAVGDDWLVDYFAVGESNRRYAVVAERVTIHPPDGHELTTRPPGSAVRDGAATWRGPADDGGGDDFDRQTYLTYGPEGGLVPTAAGWTSIALETVPLRLQHAALGGLPAAVVLAVAAFSIGRVDPSTPALGRLERRLSGLESARLGRILTGLGFTGALGALVLGWLQVGRLAAPGAVALATAALGYGALGGLVSSVGYRPDYRGAVAAVLGIAVGTTGLAAVVTGSAIRPPPHAFLLSTAAFLPLGYALERGGVRWPAVTLALALAGPFVLVAAVAPVGTFPIRPLLIGLLLAPAAVIAAAVGHPLSVLGGKLAAKNGPDADRRSP